MADQFRTEKDSMGEMKVPADAYYGAQTGRAVENFPISDLRFNRRFIAAMGLIKSACPQPNHSPLLPALNHLADTLDAKAKQFDNIVKIGRTHLQDATPIRLGQELSGYAAQARLAATRTEKAIRALRELPLGGTAVGTGINSHPDFAAGAIAQIAARSGVEFVEAKNHFEAQ